jgi:Na+-driven multidrug efflux pump
MSSEEASSSSQDDDLAKFEEEGDEVAEDGYTHKERERLGGKHPLKTIILLSIGPLVTQLVASIQSFIDSLYVAKAIGSKGIEVFGAVYVVEFLGQAFAQFLMAGLSIRLSYLYGAKLLTECSQLYVDFLRLGAIFGIILPCTILPVTRPIVEWFGADEELSEMCFQYMIPNTCLSVFFMVYLISCGVIQAEGKSIVFAGLQCIAFVFSVFLFDPLFLFGFKTGTYGASLATVLSQGLVGAGVTIATFNGKFIPKPTLRMFIEPFTEETKHALKMGISTLVENLSLTFPTMLMQKFVNMAAQRIGKYNEVLVVWAINEKLYLIIGGICIGFAQGYLMSASFAAGARLFKRFFSLTLHALWISTLTSTLLSLVIVFAPRTISKPWTEDPSILDVSENMLPIMFYTSFTLGLQYIAPAALQALKKVKRATILCFVTLLIPMPLFSTILYFTGDGKTNPARIFYTYTCNDMFAVLCCGIFIAVPIYKIWKLPENEVRLTTDVSEEDDFDKQEPRAIEEL